MSFIDTHTHLYSDQFDEDRDEIIERSIKEGITKFYLPNIDSSSIKGMKSLTSMFPNNCYAMMGLHPCSVNESVETELEIVETELRKGSYVAVGEIGIDLYWDKSHLEAQKKAFIKQINWAKELNLPIIIHCREAFDEILTIMDELNDDKLRGIFHCFTGTIEQANHILNYGDFKLGIGGVVTFKNAGLDHTIAKLTINDIVLETDSPYLAPMPFRGKRNESSYLIKVAEKVAEIFQTPMSEVARVTSQNALTIFNHESIG